MAYDRRLIAIAVLAIVSATVLAIPSVVADDSDAATTDTWYVYGYDLVFRDNNYSQATYSSIDWYYSPTPFTQEDRNSGAPGIRHGSGNGLNVDLSDMIAEYPVWEVNPLFVIEKANTINGLQYAGFVVNVNPIPSVNYVEFLYDEEGNPYYYSPVTRLSSVAVGVDDFVEVPPNPTRPGYTFGGWYEDPECTTPFDNTIPLPFTYQGEVHKVYPKWTVDPVSPSPGVETHFVTVQPVDGLAIDIGGMSVSRGSSFSFTVSQMDGFRFDLTGIIAVSSNDTNFKRTDNPDGSYTFTASSIDSDTVVMLTDYKQYFRVNLNLDGVSTIPCDEWVRQGSPLSLPLTSDSGGKVNAAVYMSYRDVTATTFIDGKVTIPSVEGDIIIVASSTDAPGPSPTPSSEGGGSDLWKYIAIAAIVVAVSLAVVLMVRMRRKGE